MAGVKISALAAVGSSALADIFPAVQTGVTYKETLQQVMTLFQASMTNATGLTGLITFPTAVTGASPTMAIRTKVTAADTVTLQAYNTNTLTYTTFATLTAGNPPTFTISGASITSLPAYVNDTTGTVAMVVNTGYVCNAAGLTTLTLPATFAVGTILAVAGSGAGGWIIAQNALQSIKVVAASTSVGVGGSLASTSAHDACYLVATVANTTLALVSMESAGLTVV